MNIVCKVSLCFVITGCASACKIVRKDCDDCVVYKFCHAAVTLLEKREPAADSKLTSAFCGFYYRLPMVCCSELTEVLPSSIDSVEDHPNLRLLPDSCGKNKIKIGGGRQARLYEYPWMVLLIYGTRPQFKCGGSLINKRYVLTAAHCICDQELIGARIGEHDVDTITDCQGEPPHCESKIQDLRIEEAIPHPEYHQNPTITNDIGLLRLSKPVDLSFKNAGVICLPVTQELQSHDYSRQQATVTGWGYTEKGYVSAKLMSVDVPIYTAEICRQLYNRGRKPGEEDDTIYKICAGQIGKGSCRGDSGGPLIVRSRNRSIQYGVVSYGPSLCGADFPSIYTDVTKYMNWILDTLRH